MTTIDAAAAWHVKKPIAFAVVAAFVGIGLGGCETSSNLFGSSGGQGTAVAEQTAPPNATQAAKFAIAPVIGPPDNVAKQLQAQIGAGLEKQKITVAKAPTDKSEYTLRGYVVSANEKTKTKVSYIWDVTDPAGRKVHRISGEEVAAATGGKDPWTAVSAQVVDSIVNKTTGSLVAWAPTQGQPAVAAATPPAAAPQQQVAAAKPAAAAAPPAPAATPAPAAPAQQTAAAPAPAGPTTGSIDRNAPVNALVAGVTGAPGDGSVALTNAMQKALTSKGVALTSAPAGQTYKVQGKVAVGQAKDGKQSVQIDWEVTDPQGKFFKRVTQKNEIPQGMLDGAWGSTADAAAGAAADTIANLLPKAKPAASANAAPDKVN